MKKAAKESDTARTIIKDTTVHNTVNPPRPLKQHESLAVQAVAEAYKAMAVNMAVALANMRGSYVNQGVALNIEGDC